jgi:malonyl-CoA/methylmalonyl-CoA synthetase
VAVVAAKGDPGDVVGALREGLAAFKLPKHVAVVEDLPRNAIGRVQKDLLRDRYAGLFAG